MSGADLLTPLWRTPGPLQLAPDEWATLQGQARQQPAHARLA
ncbi:MAG: hypothetical protein RL227_2126, partial [Pseudomonadota bacterium]